MVAGPTAWPIFVAWLASSGADGQAAAFEAILWIGGLILVMMLAAAVLWCLRKRLHPSESAPAPNLTLEDLRRLHDSGGLTGGEYDVLRRKALEVHGKLPGKRE